MLKKDLNSSSLTAVDEGSSCLICEAEGYCYYREDKSKFGALGLLPDMCCIALEYLGLEANLIGAASFYLGDREESSSESDSDDEEEGGDLRFLSDLITSFLSALASSSG